MGRKPGRQVEPGLDGLAFGVAGGKHIRSEGSSVWTGGWSPWVARSQMPESGANSQAY